MMTEEEARIRTLVYSKTGEAHLISDIPRYMTSLMQPGIIGIDIFKLQEFRSKIQQWRDVYESAVRHGLMVESNYILLSYGSSYSYGEPYNNVRFDAETMRCKNGDQVFGYAGCDMPIDIPGIGAGAKISMQPDGVYVTDLKFAVSGCGELMEQLFWSKLTIAPIFTGSVNIKSRMVCDCIIKGFYFPPTKSSVWKQLK